MFNLEVQLEKFWTCEAALFGSAQGESKIRLPEDSTQVYISRLISREKVVLYLCNDENLGLTPKYRLNVCQEKLLLSRLPRVICRVCCQNRF